MRTLPRHLLLAAVLLTVCCAERQAAAATLPGLEKGVATLGDHAEQVRHVERQAARRNDRHRFIRPAVPAWADATPCGFGHSSSLIRPETPVIHAAFPPSRFRLPPPASVLA